MHGKPWSENINEPVDTLDEGGGGEEPGVANITDRVRDWQPLKARYPFLIFPLVFLTITQTNIEVPGVRTVPFKLLDVMDLPHRCVLTDTSR